MSLIMLSSARPSTHGYLGVLLLLRRRQRRLVRRHRCWNSSVAAVADGNGNGNGNDDDDDDDDVLVEFRGARLRYPSTSTATTATATATQPLTAALDLKISSPTRGGHALLGRNSTGKSLVGQAIVSRGSDDYVQEGTVTIPPRWMSNAVAHVSFDSHQALLTQAAAEEEREGAKNAMTMTMTTHRAISQGGSLNKAAQFLIVRFGLYGLLQRDVDTLSTGEIRKVLLVRALSTRPKLLILDNAFDGLDVASREVLKELVQKTIVGFTNDILVQGVNSKATAHTQVLLMTHRAEELVDEVERISWFDNNSSLTGGGGSGKLVTEERNGRSGTALLEAALEMESGRLQTLDWNDATLPSADDIASWWKRGRETSSGSSTSKQEETSSSPRRWVEAENMSVHRGDATLIHDLNWTVSAGQRWLVGGGNGAGKSTLSRLLARPEEDSTLKIHGRVAWVSTERHMELADSDQIVRDLLITNEAEESGATTATTATATLDSALEVARWLGVQETLDRPLRELSQGQQKLVLIAAVLAARPDVAVLDEPCQGLDGHSRQRVLALVEHICQQTDIGLVYITHHLEELLPSVTHALHLKERRDVYNGPIEDYRPADFVP